VRLLAAVLLVAAAVEPTPEIRYFHSQRPVQLAPDASGQACAVLDPTIFAGASQGLADLRLYGNSVEVPYVVHSASAPAMAPQSIAPLNLGQRKGKTVFDAEMAAAEYSDLRLSVTGQNFLATVLVSGSQTETGPQTRIGSYTIFDFAGQKLGRSTVLHLPKSNFRVLHFEVAGPLSPGQIEGLSAAPAPPSEPKYLDVASAVHFVQKGRESIAEFTVPAHVPVERIVFVPPVEPVNFSRDVTVEVVEVASQKDGTPQNPPSSASSYGNLLRLHRVQDGHRIDEENLVAYPPQRFFDAPEKWTITVVNGDDAPIRFGSVRLEMLQRELCFEATPRTGYVLYYGDAVLRSPRYDYARWFAPQAGAAVAVLGPEATNEGYQQRPDPRPFTERHPALLWLALIVVVLLLGFIALRSAKRVEPPASMP
jgi:hypothetical protein